MKILNSVLAAVVFLPVIALADSNPSPPPTSDASPADRNAAAGAAAHNENSKGKKSGWTKAEKSAMKDKKAGSADGSTGMKSKDEKPAN